MKKFLKMVFSALGIGWSQGCQQANRQVNKIPVSGFEEEYNELKSKIIATDSWSDSDVKRQLLGFLYNYDKTIELQGSNELLSLISKHRPEIDFNAK